MMVSSQGVGGSKEGDRGVASRWVARFIGGIAEGGRALDVASGGGRHLRLLRERGIHVTGIDRDHGKVGDLTGDPRVRLISADLENGSPFPVAGEKFDGVIVTNYLWRPILADIVAAVARDGVLIYETFALGQQRFGRPTNPDFLLRPGELLDRIGPDLVAIAYEHGTIAEPLRVVQRIVAVGRDHDWVGAPPLFGEAGGPANR